MIIDNLHNVIITGDEFRLSELIDTHHRNRALCDHDAMEIYLPSLVKAEDLGKMGYYNSFAGHVTDVYPHMDERSVCECSLTPAACLPLYPIVPSLDVGDDFCITSNVNVFRYEEGRREYPTRLWDFNVREVIFVGSESYVKDSLDMTENNVKQFCEKINLDISTDIASDYFTATSPEIEAMKKLQIANRLKREVVWNDIALASINYHGTHFSKKYNWDNDGKIVSGCVGYGIQRWLHCLVTEFDVNNSLKLLTEHGCTDTTNVST